MNRLYDDMISTADSFAVNFSDRGTFDYSFDSLTLAEELLDEMADYIFEDDEAVYNASTMIGAYVFETVRRNLGGEYVWLQKEEQPNAEGVCSYGCISIRPQGDIPLRPDYYCNSNRFF